MKGFETRQTTIGKKLITWQNLQQNTGPGQRLTTNPLQLSHLKEMTKSLHVKSGRRYQKQRKKHSKMKKHRIELNENLLSNLKSLNSSIKGSKKRKKEHEFYKSALKMGNHKIEAQSLAALLTATTAFEINDTLLEGSVAQPLQMIGSLDEYFCNAPAKEYSHFVVEVKPILLDLNSFLAICELQEKIIAANNYKEYCQRSLIGTNDCCRSWSVANYAAFVANKTSCYDLEVKSISIRI